jgi:putative NIF3 family GTP cyclohydrolase 1 type 2
MKLYSVVDLLVRAVPRNAAWEIMANEPYGYRGPRDANAEIQRVLYCVTPSTAIETYYRLNRYDLVVSHHPTYLRNDIPHVILHTALDCCDGGLNDQWRDGLGIRNALHFDHRLGWYGDIEPIDFDALCVKVSAFMERPIIGARHSLLDTIKSLVVCSGLGGSVVSTAHATGADCYITGELTTPAHTTGFPAIIETGHTNSEWIGARLIRKLLEPHGVTVEVAPDSCDRFGREVFDAHPAPQRRRVVPV